VERSPYTAEAVPRDNSRRSEGIGQCPGNGAHARDLLASVLEHELVPRLMTARRTTVPHSTVPRPSGLANLALASVRPSVDEAQVQGLVDISLTGEAKSVRAFILNLRDQGVPVDALYLDLITPAARRIGAMWEADTCDFVLVTLALLRIQQVMYDLSPEFIGAGCEPSSRRALVLPTPGSHHTLGAAMVADFFRRGGWDVISSHELQPAEVLRAVRQDWFDVVALSMSAPNHVASTGALISDIRKLSSNKGILVMVGGPLALSVPELATRVGADVVTLDARQALEVAGRAVPVRRMAVAN